MELEPSKVANWEAVSRASIELIAAIRDLADYIDPTFEVDVGLQSGQEGSLRLNAVLAAVFRSGDEEPSDDGAAKRSTGLKSALCGMLGWFAMDTASHLNGVGVEAFLQIWGSDTPEVAEQTLEQCVEVLEGAKRNGVGEEHIRKFYAEMSRDPAILGVGIAPDHDAKPLYIVPREQFPFRAKAPEPSVLEDKRRRTERLHLQLVQPRLLGDNKAWRFASGGVEFSAKIEDHEFVRNLLTGKIGVRMVEGVFLDASLHIEEERRDDVWVIKSRTVKRVFDVREATEQVSLFRVLDNDEDEENNR